MIKVQGIVLTASSWDFFFPFGFEIKCCSFLMPPGPSSVNWFYFKKGPFFHSDREDGEVGGAERSDWKWTLWKKKQEEMEGSLIGERVKENTAVTNGSEQTLGVAH